MLDFNQYGYMNHLTSPNSRYVLFQLGWRPEQWTSSKPRFRSSSCTTTKCCFTSISIPHSAYTRYASIRISCLFCSIPFRLHSYCGIWGKRDVGQKRKGDGSLL